MSEVEDEMTKSWFAWQDQKRQRLREENPENYAKLCQKLETRRRFERSMREDRSRRREKNGGRDLFDDECSLPSYTSDDAVDGHVDAAVKGRYYYPQNGDEPGDTDHETFPAEEVTAEASREPVPRRLFIFKGAANAQSSRGARDIPVRGNANGKRARAETEEIPEHQPAQPLKRRRRASPSNSRQFSPALDPANSQLVLRSTQSVVSTQDFQDAPRQQQRSFTTTKYGGDWPHLRRADKFLRMSTDKQAVTLRNWMAEISEYADAIEAPAIPASMMTRFFRRVQTHINDARQNLPVDDLEAAFQDANAACQEGTDTREDFIRTFLRFLSPNDRRLLEKGMQTENPLQDDYIPL